MESSKSPDLARAAPWFRRNTRVVLALAVAMFVAIFLLRMATEGTLDAVGALYVLPVALVAVAFGTTGGLVAAAVVVLSHGTRVLFGESALPFVGWVTRAVPVLLLGGLLGHATDRLCQANDAERDLALARERAHEGIEINDSILQGLTVARWTLEGGDRERALEILSETMVLGQGLVADLLRDQPVRPGALRRVSPSVRSER